MSTLQRHREREWKRRHTWMTWLEAWATVHWDCYKTSPWMHRAIISEFQQKMLTKQKECNKWHVVWFSRQSETWERGNWKNHTHKKVSCGILASDTGKGPDKLLLLSLLLSLWTKENSAFHILHNKIWKNEVATSQNKEINLLMKIYDKGE